MKNYFYLRFASKYYYATRTTSSYLDITGAKVETNVVIVVIIYKLFIS